MRDSQAKKKVLFGKDKLYFTMLLVLNPLPKNE